MNLLIKQKEETESGENKVYLFEQYFENMLETVDKSIRKELANFGLNPRIYEDKLNLKIAKQSVIAKYGNLFVKNDPFFGINNPF